MTAAAYYLRRYPAAACIQASFTPHLLIRGGVLFKQMNKKMMVHPLRHPTSTRNILHVVVVRWTTTRRALSTLSCDTNDVDGDGGGDTSMLHRSYGPRHRHMCMEELFCSSTDQGWARTYQMPYHLNTTNMEWRKR